MAMHKPVKGQNGDWVESEQEPLLSAYIPYKEH